MRPVELGHVAAGEGPTLVALHGGLLSGRLTFGPVLADWAQRFRVLVPDRRGFEHTPAAGPATIAEQARDLEAFIDEHADGRAHVLGFSFGGVVALTALQLERRLFASLTVVEAPAVTLCGRDPGALDLRMRLADLYDRALDGDGPDVARDFFGYMDPRALSRIEALLATDDPGLHIVHDELRIWRTPLSPAGLAGVQTPVLAVTGQRSPAAMHRIGELVADAAGGRHHVQHAAGHAAHLVGRPFRDVLCAHVADAEATAAVREAVTLAPHDPAWAARYEHERGAVAGVLGDAAVEIAHVGSTAVPGMAAKPIIDLMIGVDGSAVVHAVGRRLRAAGYAVRDDPAATHDDGHVFGLRGADGHRVAHAHVVAHGGRWWREHLAFRDRLCADPDLRDRYTRLKQRLAVEHRDDRDAYTDAKTAFVTAALADGRMPR
jgi:GrpB-like predicted nucleotidyltransferase (UPF0157 family)/pimeloyl-ACP methyl ester carboxylesterase